jgi:hypothetical protein
MSNGVSLHIGIARSRIERDAPGADVSARMLRDIARSKGFKSADRFQGLLIDDDATRKNVLECLDLARKALQSSDILLVTFTGHGRFRRGVEAEPTDQSMVLSDGELIDNEVYEYLSSIEVPARVLFIVNACFSGSIQTAPFDHLSPAATLEEFDRRTRRLASRETREYLRSRAGWRRDFAAFPRGLRSPLKVNALLLASSEDTTRTPAAPGRCGAPPFSCALADVWESSSEYRDLRQRIEDRLFELSRNAIQPVLNGRLVTDERFVAERPFTI